MDIYVCNIPPNASNRELRDFFCKPLKACGIDNFHADKKGNKPMATITVLDAQAGINFLNRHGIPPSTPRNRKIPQPLQWGKVYVHCSKGKYAPSEFSLQALAYEGSQGSTQALVKQDKGKAHTGARFDIRGCACGVWEYEESASTTVADVRVSRPRQDITTDSHLVFVPHFEHSSPGTITFGRRQAIMILGIRGSDQYRLDINYRDCVDVAVGCYDQPAVTFNLQIPPKMYEIMASDILEAEFERLGLSPRTARSQMPHLKTRIPAINTRHAEVAGSCFVYRIVLSDFKDVGDILSRLRSNAATYSIAAIKTPARYPPRPLSESFIKLTHELSDTRRFGAKPFGLRFQAERLARNGKLSPEMIMALLPSLERLLDTYGPDPTLTAIRRFYERLPAPGPHNQAEDHTVSALESMLEDLADRYDSDAPDNTYNLVKRHNHIIHVHKVIITPTQTILSGPEPEPTNRVLRRYADYSDHFIRVVFADEDGGSVRYDSRADNSVIFHQRFKNVLDRGILIAGQLFSFLGFSHSSLRSQSCWFMAPLLRGGHFAFAEQVLEELGDFSHIRTPAKCAARIGQNFTDTNATVEVGKDEVSQLAEVSRNGRVFSDGVGTISAELLESVYRVYGSRRLLKPTLLQIRFQGAKGMVSLDSRLEGKRLNLRSSMTKFETEATRTLEICGAGFRPLPMVLNRQFIKIFEDLGVPMDVFMHLQTKVMKWLQLMTSSSVNTATFLEQSEGTKATKLPSLIRHLAQIGLDYHQDAFLYKVVEMAVVSKLRDIKYRGRIPVEQGVTLYGIMDETGVLREGEIFVITEKAPEGGQVVMVRDEVVVTRSPALHPGDIQVVNAVDVQEFSPLKRLSNVVVFSQHGSRDLPSKLSGGDLDGDLYNIIWDRELLPVSTYEAADYPRVAPLELDRAVTRKDMSDFLVTFMESDLLGLISNRHMQMADQRPTGSLDPDCIKLAGMASTAVDFSKTGIAVNMANAPRADPCKPDFMAPSPRVMVSEKGLLEFEHEDREADIAFEDLDVEQRPIRYYRSEKTLGHLYRAIDEHQFLAKLQSDHQALTVSSAADRPITRILNYVKQWAAQYGISYSHQLPFAEDIRSSYEESLVDIIYTYEPSPHMPLSESEVFAGTILGRQGGAQGKPLRELSKTMRERFETVVEYATMRIIKGDQIMQGVEDLDELYETYNERELEALPRAIACLDVAVNQCGHKDSKIGELTSFRYIAAGVCLAELDRFRITTFGSYGGLPLMEEETKG